MRNSLQLKQLAWAWFAAIWTCSAAAAQGSDAWIEECIALAMLTKPGERDQVPTFGVNDPAFALFQLGALQRHLIDFGPEVTITEVLVDELTEGRERAVVSWERTDTPTRGVLEA